MGRFTERVESMRISAVSPDGQITARLAGGSRLGVGFAAGAYGNYDEDALGTQLSALLTNLFEAYRRARFEALSQVTMELSGLPAEPLDPRYLDRADREFHHRQESLETRGRSADDTVRVLRVGLTSWTVRVRPGRLRLLDEDGFQRRLAGAMSAAHNDYQVRVSALRAEIYPRDAADSRDLIPSHS